MSRPTREQVAHMAERRYPYEHVGYPSPPPDDCDCDECFRTEVRRLAYAEGWTDHAHRPRETVTTVEGLDALPVGSVVRSEQGGVFERWSTHSWREAGFTWHPDSTDIALPATVLDRPEETP